MSKLKEHVDIVVYAVGIPFLIGYFGFEFISNLFSSDSRSKAFELIDEAKYQEANEMLLRLIEKDPDGNKDLHNYVGLNYMYLNKHTEAIEAFVVATEKEPLNPICWFNLGTSHYKIQDHFKAIAALRKCLSLDKRQWDAYQYLGSIYLELNDKESALDVIQILKRNNQYPMARELERMVN